MGRRVGAGTGKEWRARDATGLSAWRESGARCPRREVRAGRAVREKGWAKENGTGPDAVGKGGEGGLGCLGWLGPVGWAWRREKKRMAGVWQFGLGCVSRFGFGLGLLPLFFCKPHSTN